MLRRFLQALLLISCIALIWIACARAAGTPISDSFGAQSTLILDSTTGTQLPALYLIHTTADKQSRYLLIMWGGQVVKLDLGTTTINNTNEGR